MNNFTKHSCLHMACAALRTGLCLAALAHLPLGAQTALPSHSAAGGRTVTIGSQTQAAAARQQAEQASATAAASVRFIESCNQAAQRGKTDLGCQSSIYRNELERLQREALTSQNPQLLSFVASTYENPRTGMGDMGQAYRWYVLAATRGDISAMQRLAEMNRRGHGSAPRDKVKALGYARLVGRMARISEQTLKNDDGELDIQRKILDLIDELGAEMAVEEMALAERFAAELQARIEQVTHDFSSSGVATPSLSPSAAQKFIPGVSGIDGNRR